MTDGGVEVLTAAHVALARRLRQLHSEPRYEHGVGPAICWWCLKPWPCPDRRWVDGVARRYATATSASVGGGHAAP